jgi:isopentenyldiphosphate isomerase
MCLVNESDEIVGYLDRTKVDYQTMIYRVTALWLTNPKKEILIAKRSNNKDRDPGKWGPAVAGTVEKGESYQSNIYKEAGEEIGLTGYTFKLGPKLRMTSPRNYFCQFFFLELSVLKSDFVLQRTEVDAVAWISKPDLRNDVAINPAKYIPSFPAVLAGLYPAEQL